MTTGEALAGQSPAPPLVPSLSHRLPPRCRARVTGAEQIGPYTLLRLERGGWSRDPGQFFMLEAPGRLLPRPMSLCLAPPGELGFLIDPIGRERALLRPRPGGGDRCAGPARERLRSLGRALATSWRRDRDRADALPRGGARRPAALLGFRNAHHAEAASLLPRAGALEPTLVTELLPDDPGDVLACGPEPMLEALRALIPGAQLAWEAPMRLWSLLRLRRGDRRPFPSSLRGRPGARGP